MKRFQKAELLLNFAVFSKGLDAKDKIKLALFASRTKPNTYIVLKINPAAKKVSRATPPAIPRPTLINLCIID